MSQQRPKDSKLRMQFNIILQLAATLALTFISGANSQEDGDVKLINGPTDYQGRVAVYYNHTWGSLCDDSWQVRDADAICRQLGFLKASRVLYRAYYGQSSGPIWVDQINCPSGADHILKCTPKLEGWGIHDCRHKEDAGVDCQRKVPNQKPEKMPLRISCPEHQQEGSCKTCSDKMHPVPNDCTEQAAVEGVVSAFYEGDWHPVSGEGFSIEEAKVVCGELGYPLVLGIPHLGDLWTNWDGQYLRDCKEPGSGSSNSSFFYVPSCTPQEIFENLKYRRKLRNTLLKRLDCVGNERRLLDCYFSEFGPSKSVLNVATVRCGFKPHHTCSSKESTTETYRLRGGSVPWVGRLEVSTTAGTWATVCDQYWDNIEAGIVCRAMGYGGAKKSHYRAYYGRGVGEILYTQLRCNGSEKTLSGCSDKATGSTAQGCRHQGDVGVECIVPDVCPGAIEEVRPL